MYRIIKQLLVPLIFGVLVAVLFGYIFSLEFRLFLIKQSYDANYIFGFVALCSLLFSFWEGSKNRKLTYNLNLQSRLEDTVMRIIGKLQTIDNKSESLIKIQDNYQSAINDRITYVDANNIIGFKDSIDQNIELISSAIYMYFPDISTKWNQIQNLLNIVGDNALNIELNYNANLNLILRKQPFNNDVLDKIELLISESKSAQSEIATLSREIADSLLEVLVNNQINIRYKL